MGKAQSKEYIQCEKMKYDHCTPYSLNFLLQMYYSQFAFYNFAPLRRSAAMSASEFAKACARAYKCGTAVSFFLT